MPKTEFVYSKMLKSPASGVRVPDPRMCCSRPSKFPIRTKGLVE